MLHKVKIVYPGDKTFEFDRFSNGDMDLFFEMLLVEWKHNSGRECEMFKDANIRSFVNHDFIVVDDVCYISTVNGMIPVESSLLTAVEKSIKTHKFSRNPFWAKLEVFEQFEKEGGENWLDKFTLHEIITK